MLLFFHRWEAIYYKYDYHAFPSDSVEERVRFVGIAEYVGHYMTFKMLSEKTKRVVCRIDVRTAEDSVLPNKRLDDLINDESQPVKDYIWERIPIYGENIDGDKNYIKCHH